MTLTKTKLSLLLKQSAHTDTIQFQEEERKQLQNYHIYTLFKHQHHPTKVIKVGNIIHTYTTR